MLKEEDFEYFQNNTPKPPEGSLRERDDLYYEILGGGAKLHLLEGMFDLGLIELLVEHGELTAQDICDKLALNPHRGWKFLHALHLSGFLDEIGGEYGEDDAVFSLSKLSKRFFGEKGEEGFYFKDLVNFWRNVATLPLVDVLRGMPLPEAVVWPPQDIESAEHLELWMRVTAQGAIDTLINSGTFNGVNSFLDIGGGDGTMACSLVDKYPGLGVTVFNLPNSAYIARRIIAEKGKTNSVKVVEGDFFKDDFPKGFDRVAYSRVLTDWQADVCEMCLNKAREALAPGGKVLINEALLSGNENYSLAWEFRYIFYDTFGRNMYKTLRTYSKILKNAGLKIEKFHPMINTAFYSVIEAVPIS